MDKDTAPAAPVIVSGDDLAEETMIGGIHVLPLSAWRARVENDGAALADMTVLGLALCTPDAKAVAADPELSGLIAAAGIPLRDIGAMPTSADLREATFSLLLARHDAAVRDAAQERAALAELRRTHMQMQADHADLEAWVWDALAPKHHLVRSWPATAHIVAMDAGEVMQPLPVPARGFIAVDLHIAESAPEGGHVSLRLTRPVGPDFEGCAALVAVPAGAHGWFRLTLPRAGGGMAEDAVLTLAYTHPDKAALRVSLAPDSPFADYRATMPEGPASAPLALRVYRTLPHMPAPALVDPRFGPPADGATRLVTPADLGAPVQLPYFGGRVRRRLAAYPDAPRVEYWQTENAVLVHPSIRRPVMARVPGLQVEALAQLRGIVQISRHDTLPVAFAIGVAPAGSANSVETALAHLGDWVHLLPGEWGEVWTDPPAGLSGDLDLLLATAMPNMPFNRNAHALFHGFRVTTRQADTLP